MSVALPLAAGAPAATSAALWLLGRRVELDAAAVGRWATGGSAAAFLLTAVVGVSVATDGPVSAVVAADAPLGTWGFAANELVVLFLLLVTGVGTLVQAFAVRYLRGDRQAARFALLAGALVATTAATVTAVNLIQLALAWTATSLVLRGLLGLYGELPAAKAGVRSATRALGAGDAALWAAVAIATATWGVIDLRDLAELAPRFAENGAVTAVVGCLLVGAAMARGGLFPAHRWLTATLAAPTPVSALLHAGVVNGGGMLLILLAPLFGASSTATSFAFVAGAVTVVVGTTLMLVRPDVKGALALSTVGQMGFMVMACGLGAYVAAAFHLVAHGMYKASLFLASGSAIDRRTQHLEAPPRLPLTRSALLLRAVVAASVPAVGLLVAKGVLSSNDRETSALLAFAWATLALSGWGWLRTATTTLTIAVYFVATAVATVAYVVALNGMGSVLEPALAGAGDASASPWLLVPLLAALAAVARLRATGDDARRDAAYVLALNAATGLGRPQPALTHPLPHRPSPSHTLVHGSR